MKTKQKQEALKRMKKLNLFDEAVALFERSDIVFCSEGGILYHLNEEQKTIVKNFEEEYGALVYAVIHNRTECGDMHAMLYVSKNENEWHMDWDDLNAPDAEKHVIAAVYGAFGTVDIGSVGVRNRFGGLIRAQ